MNQVNDLRTALGLLASMPGQLIETDVPVEPLAELAGVYRYVGAGGTVKRPTKEGPAMFFNQVKGHPGARVAIGVLASRQRAAALLDCPPEELGKRLWQSVDHPIPPVLKEGPALCQQVVHRADAPDFDLRTLVPAPTNTPDDAGPYITMGMCYATHPDTGEKDVTIHRLCIQGRDELSIYTAKSTASSAPDSWNLIPKSGWGTTADGKAHSGRSLLRQRDAHFDPVPEAYPGGGKRGRTDPFSSCRGNLGDRDRSHHGGSGKAGG